jgi:hypothetical protein
MAAVTLAVVGAALCLPASAADDHKVLSANEIKWSPGPGIYSKGR